jgi:hypothetical protein
MGRRSGWKAGNLNDCGLGSRAEEAVIAPVARGVLWWECIAGAVRQAIGTKGKGLRCLGGLSSSASRTMGEENGGRRSAGKDSITENVVVRIADWYGAHAPRLAADPIRFQTRGLQPDAPLLTSFHRQAGC